MAWLAGDMVRAIRGYRQQLHDVVSHSLSTIAVQAGVARLVLATQPGQAGPALSAIETASRSALDELRTLLRQIRDPEDVDEAAAPTLSDLPALIDKLRRPALTSAATAPGSRHRTAPPWNCRRTGSCRRR